MSKKVCFTAYVSSMAQAIIIRTTMELENWHSSTIENENGVYVLTMVKFLDI